MTDVTCLIVPGPLWLALGEQDPEFLVEVFLKGVEILKNVMQILKNDLRGN